MARTEDAMHRILYLLGRGPRRATPATLTTLGRPSDPRIVIRSYALPICEYDTTTQTLTVYEQTSTRTTNRHIKAAQRLADALNWE